MPKVSIVQNAFTSGILSPLLKGRTDIEQYANGVEFADDVLLIPQGGLKRRPGTLYQLTINNELDRNTTVPTMPNGGSGIAINDGSDASGTITTTGISTINPYVVAHYDLSAPTLIDYVDIRLMNLSVGSSAQFQVQWSSDNAAWNFAFNVPVVSTTDTVTLRRAVGVTARYWRLARIGAIDLGVSQVTLSEFNLYEQGSFNENVKLVDMSVDQNNHYLLIFTQYNLSIYDDLGTELFTFKTDYSGPQSLALRTAQSENVLIIVHPQHRPQRLIRFADNDWTLDDVPFITVPSFDFNDSLSPTPVDEIQRVTVSGVAPGNHQFQWDLNGVTSKSTTFSDTTGTDTAANWQKNLLDMPVVGFTGVDVQDVGAGLIYEITFSGESADDYQEIIAYALTGPAIYTTSVIQDGSPRKEAVWSDTRGYPGSVAFFEGRLWFGGTQSKPQSLFGSNTGNFFNFDIGEGLDDQAIFVTIATRRLNEVFDVFPGRNLQIFTSAAEFVIPTSPATPTNLSVSLQTSHGTNRIEPIDIDGATIFVDVNGRTVRNFFFSDNEQAYVTSDLSVLTPEIINNPVDIAAVRGTLSTDANWIFLVNEAGDMSVLNTLRAQGVNGFTRWLTGGKITNIATLNNELWTVNHRVIDGNDVNYLEKWDFDRVMDSAKTYSLGGVPTDTFTGLEHLEGQTVRTVAEGVAFPEQVVTGGQIVLPRAVSNGVVEIGLNFVPRVKIMPMAPNFGSGSRQMRLKKMVRHNVRVQDTISLYLDGIPQTVRTFGESGETSPLDTPPDIFTGVIQDIEGQFGWGRDQAPTITQPDPFAMTLLAIETEVEAS